jgi:filamentous hemagglutinin
MVKQAAEPLKNQVRNKLGEATTSSIANGIINYWRCRCADYAADAALALVSCTTVDSYCGTALNDFAG